MSGYIGYLGRNRHSTDERNAIDIRRASAEHQGLEYKEFEYNEYKSQHDKTKNTSYKSNCRHAQNDNYPAASYRDSSSSPQLNINKPKRHSKARKDGDIHSNYNEIESMDRKTAVSSSPKKSVSDCKVVYKKSRKLGLHS